MDKKLGKIEEVTCGFGGYMDAQIGFSFTITGDGWAIGTPFLGAWSGKRGDGAMWTEEDRLLELGRAWMEVNTLMTMAKVTQVKDLVGIPVEVTFENFAFNGWRILAEVI